VTKNATSTLGLDMETLVELTPEDAQQINGGYASLSSANPQGGAVSSALPPKPKHKHHHKVHKAVSSVRPI
jgi:hypothetical protein